MPIIFGDAGPEPSDVGIYGTAIAVGYLFLRVAEWGLTWLYKWWEKSRSDRKADATEQRANWKADESETIAFLKEQVGKLEERHELNERRCNERIEKLEAREEGHDAEILDLNRDIAILRADRHNMVGWIRYHVSVMQQNNTPFLNPPSSFEIDLPKTVNMTPPTKEATT